MIEFSLGRCESHCASVYDALVRFAGSDCQGIGFGVNRNDNVIQGDVELTGGRNGRAINHLGNNYRIISKAVALRFGFDVRASSFAEKGGAAD